MLPLFLSNSGEWADLLESINQFNSAIRMKTILNTICFHCTMPYRICVLFYILLILCIVSLKAKEPSRANENVELTILNNKQALFTYEFRNAYNIQYLCSISKFDANENITNSCAEASADSISYGDMPLALFDIVAKVSCKDGSNMDNFLFYYCSYNA